MKDVRQAQTREEPRECTYLTEQGHEGTSMDTVSPEDLQNIHHTREGRDDYMLQEDTPNNFARLVEISRTALDRECGSCHHSNRSTNTQALAIFDLAKDCWYCTVTPHQSAGLSGRTEDTEKFDDQEKVALAAIVQKINAQAE